MNRRSFFQLITSAVVASSMEVLGWRPVIVEDIYLALWAADAQSQVTRRRIKAIFDGMRPYSSADFRKP